MRSAMVLDNVYPVLEKQAMNLYDLKEAEYDTEDLRFIWEKQEAYVETLKHTRDLQYVHSNLFVTFCVLTTLFF